MESIVEIQSMGHPTWSCHINFKVNGDSIVLDPIDKHSLKCPSHFRMKKHILNRHHGYGYVLQVSVQS